MTFEEFQLAVSSEWPNADEVGLWRNYTAEGKIDPGRIYYTWQHQHFGAISFDTQDNATPWGYDAGRGVCGWGASLGEAKADEDQLYAPY